MPAFDPTLSGLVSSGLRANPFNFRGAAPVQPSQQTQKGIKWALQNLDQNLGAAEGIPAMPAFGGQAITPGFDTKNLFAGARGTVRTTSPNTTFQHADDEYNRLISQYGPSGIQQLAGMTSLPTGFTPTGSNKPASLKDYYGAQTLQGSANLGSIISEMGYKGDMAKWAQANPMLAQREYDKRFGGATLASAVHPDGSVRGMPQAISGLDTSKMMPTAAMQGTSFPGQGEGPTFNPAAFTDKSNFGTPANAVPAPPTQQGAAVSAPYAEAQRQAAEKTAGATGMPQFPTLGGDWLSKVMASPWGQALKNTGGAMGIDYIQGIR